jgi:predicted transcriptional regulator
LGSSEQAEKTKMNTVNIGVPSISDTRRRASAAFRGKKQCARISFASEDLLWKTLTPKRWALLKLMAGQGSMAIREIARRADRDVRAVHSDIGGRMSQSGRSRVERRSKSRRLHS